MGSAYLHFVHDGRGNDKPTFRIFQWMPPPRYGNAMLRCVHMTIDYVVFTTYKDAGWSVVTI